MPSHRAPVDRGGFAARREVREILGRIVTRGHWTPTEFEKALCALRRRRRLALRNLLRFFADGRVNDEVAALELLGRLAGLEDDDTLAGTVNDTASPEAARVACGLVLLGHNRTDLIRASDVSGLILRWQARFVAEEPSLRQPLIRLYRSAPRRERASWAALQDQELVDPEGRAAVFEMLLEVEADPDLRGLLLDALSRTPGPASRAALRRVEPEAPAERDTITAALAALAAETDAASTPAGWSAKVGYCDGAGSFPLRFDFRLAPRRPRTALFVLNLETGVRESLALWGPDVDRYDELDITDGQAAGADPPASMLHPVPAAVGLGFLVHAERADRSDGRAPPRDHVCARRLLDPLADVQPRAPEPLAAPLGVTNVERTAQLLDHPGYAGWFYDAGDRLLDDLRLELLHSGRRDGPDAALIARASQILARSGEPRRIVRMLRHNSYVHRAAGENDLADLALAAVGAISAGAFVGLPLTQRMVRDSLHPGHYFFTPVPDAPERLDLAGLLVRADQPSKVRVFAVDLALILSRAFEVWLSRTPSNERPHGDQVQQTVVALAQAGARTVVQNTGCSHSAPGKQVAEFDPDLRARLRTRYGAVLPKSGFPRTRSDPDHGRLLDALVGATEALVVRLCLRSCPQRCPQDPRGAGRQALRRGFPAGRQAEMFIRTWPGVFLHEPTPSERNALAAMLGRARLTAPPVGAPDSARGPFHCALCALDRPITARARNVLLPHDRTPPQPVCRRCRDRYQRDPAFRAEIIARLGKLL